MNVVGGLLKLPLNINPGLDFLSLRRRNEEFLGLHYFGHRPLEKKILISANIYQRAMNLRNDHGTCFAVDTLSVLSPSLNVTS